MPHTPPPTPPRSANVSPARPLDTDSVFGDDSDSQADFLDVGPPAQEHSNLPLVRRQFMAAGYRAGLDAAKTDGGLAQRGFDEGYRAGAVLGMRAGYLRAMQRASGSTDSSDLQIESLVEALQNQGHLVRDESAEIVVDEDENDAASVTADDAISSHDKLMEQQQQQQQEEWRLPDGAVDGLPTVQQATSTTQAWLAEQYGRGFSSRSSRPAVNGDAR